MVPHSYPLLARRLGRASVVACLFSLLLVGLLTPVRGQGGNWRINITYSGTCDTSVSLTDWVPGGIFDRITPGAPSLLPPNYSYNLSNSINNPASTTSGGATAKLSVSSEFNTKRGGGPCRMTLNGAQVTFTLTWQPAGGDASADPAPPAIAIWWRCRADAGAYAYTYGGGQSGAASAVINAGSASAAVTANSPGNPNPAPVSNVTSTMERLDVTNGSVTKTFTLYAGLTESGSAMPDSPTAVGGAASGTMTIDLVVLGLNPARFDKGSPVTGKCHRPLAGGLWDPLESTCRHASLSIL